MRIELVLLAAVAALNSFGATATETVSHEQIYVIPAINDTDLGLDLVALIKQPLVAKHEVITQGIKLVEELKTAPSCHRLAAATLIESCQDLTINDAKQGVSVLEQVNSIYAARLAVCELKGANADIPRDCNSLMRQIKPTSTSGRQQLPKFEQASFLSKQIQTCLKALECRPQSWTSYSNARQNAVVICHATRNEIEKENILEVHRAMVENSANTMEALAKTASYVESSQKQQAMFLEAIKSLHDQLINDIEADYARAEGVFNGMLHSAESGLSGLVQRIATALQSGLDVISKFQTGLDTADDALDTLHSTINDLTRHVAERDTGFALSHEQRSEDHSALATRLQETLTGIEQTNVQALKTELDTVKSVAIMLAQALATIDHNSASLEKRVTYLSNGLQTFEEWLNSTSELLEVRQNKSMDILANMTAQLEASTETAREFSQSLSHTTLLGTSLIRMCSVAGEATAIMIAIWFVNLLFGLRAARLVTLICFLRLAYLYTLDIVKPYLPFLHNIQLPTPSGLDDGFPTTFILAYARAYLYLAVIVLVVAILYFVYVNLPSAFCTGGDLPEDYKIKLGQDDDDDIEASLNDGDMIETFASRYC